MKNISHWKARYVCNRVIRYYHEKRIQSCPWFAIGAIRFLEKWLKQTDMCLEYGAGRSTVWLASRVGHIITIESNRTWYEKVKAAISVYSNVEIALLESNDNVVPGSCVGWDYVNKVKEFPLGMLDVIVNDGYARPHVGVQCLPLLKRGGIMVWDDWAHTFPTETHIPGALRADSIIKDETLLQFWEVVKEWRLVGFDDGTHSTAILFKPS
jgi:hypothetical protein